MITSELEDIVLAPLVNVDENFEPWFTIVSATSEVEAHFERIETVAELVDGGIDEEEGRVELRYSLYMETKVAIRDKLRVTYF